MPDSVNFEPDWISDIVANQFEVWMTDPLADVVFAAGEIVVKADHLFASLH